jgi:hypothetical protein
MILSKRRRFSRNFPHNADFFYMGERGWKSVIEQGRHCSSAESSEETGKNGAMFSIDTTTEIVMCMSSMLISQLVVSYTFL